MTNKTIFVTGGTGNQGGAAARNLGAKGFNVKVLTRKPHSPKALNLQKLNIELVQGDLNDPESYRAHLKEAYGVFSVQSFGNGVDTEIKEGITLATAAKEAGVQHFLYSSVAGADQHTGVRHFESKLKIESHIRQIGLPFTIVRPVSFFENFLIPQVKKGILKGKLVQAINQNTLQQYIATEDIGKAAANIFMHAEEYIGKTIPLATEQLTTQQVAEKFSEVLNKNIEYKKLPLIITRLFLGYNLYKMFKWMNDKNSPKTGDVESTRNMIPDYTSLEQWIQINFPLLPG